MSCSAFEKNAALESEATLPETAATPSKAIEASSLFLEKANSLTVIKKDDSFFVTVKNDGNKEVNYWYAPSRKWMLVTRYENGSSTSTSTYEGVSADCDNRIRKADTYNFRSHISLESNSTEDYSFPMSVGWYRLLCTEY